MPPNTPIIRGRALFDFNLHTPLYKPISVRIPEFSPSVAPQSDCPVDFPCRLCGGSLK